MKNRVQRNSKKIGQVTYYKGNYGSVLQCYATQKLLGAHGFDVCLLDICDLIVPRVSKALMRRAKLVGKMIHYPRQAGEMVRLYQNASNSAKCMELMPECVAEIECFIDRYIKKESFTSKQLKRLAKGNDFAAFISGSDQIWSATWPLPDKNFYLRFAPRYKRIAFAPSFGGTRLSCYNKEILRYISEYNLLSVRESSGKNIVREATSEGCVVINDPVLQLDCTEWERLSERSKLVIDEPYICLFFIDRPSESTAKWISCIKERYHIKMINFGYNRDFGCENIAGGPEDLLKLLKNAWLVLTDSFHGMSFSIVFHSDFYVLKRNYQHKSDQSSRITELLASCGLEDRFLTEPEIETVVSADFSQTDAFLKRVREKSNAYIYSIISLIKRGT